MDSHNVGRGRGGAESVLKQIRSRTLVIGISTDILFPVVEQKFLAQHIPGAQYSEMESIYGHDGFLVEFEMLSQILKEFYEKESVVRE